MLHWFVCSCRESKTNGEEKRKTEKNVRKIRNRVGKVGKDG